MSKALGLIETRGLVAAIEAADVMLKTANVKLIGKEITDPALVTIKITGETADVKASVEAGAAAASRVGELVSKLVISQPDPQLAILFPELKEDKNVPVKENKNIPVKKVRREIKSFSDPEKKLVSAVERISKDNEASVETKIKETSETEDKIIDTKNDFSPSDTISRLRKEALGVESSESVSSGKINLREIEILSVHQLRRLARSTEGFPIQGREISRANRRELLDHFKSLA